VEAWHARDAAQTELDNSKAANDPPEPPDEFPNLREFIEYHRSTSHYEGEVAKREKNVASAEKSYTQASHMLRDVLPENVPLHYEYMEQGDLQGTQYVIVNRQGEVSVSYENDSRSW
jgi:hypothetical protein